ncbi:hypothetical protein [Acidiphilium sp.]|uniref:hypothetical protein n=1 Tax=Acidiphilium sp. TaxID=527 RepID=UPI003D05BF01
MSRPIPREIADDGTELHLVPILPPHLPRVSRRDLERAWDAARHAAHRGEPGPTRGFRFAAPASTGVAIVLRDPDARAWAASVDRIADLSTPHGISLCLRLLGLVALIGDATWLAPYVTIRRDGAALDTALLTAAATTRLTATGGLDENQMRALLLTRATKDTDPCSA